jgi:CRISPR-associated protein Cas6
MYWEENNKDEPFAVSERIVDVVFTIECKTLPVDHAYALSQAIMQELPWLREEAGAGVHHIHIPEAAHGWMRPEKHDDLMHLSRRTRLVIRVPAHRVDETRALTGTTLDVAGQKLTITDSNVRPLSDTTTLFARHVVAEDDDNEPEFLENMAALLADMGIRPRKMLPGKQNIIHTPDGNLKTRSLMVAELKQEESMLLQENGLGSHRYLGCGIFIPHKGIKELKKD